MAKDPALPPVPPEGGETRNEARGEPRARVKFMIEVGDDRNRSVMFPPLGQRILRGRWRMSNNRGQNPDEDFVEMPDLPGMMIAVDETSREAVIRVFDPLGLEKNKTVLEKAKRIVKSKFNVRCGPDRNFKVATPPADQLKNFLYWCRRLVDNGTAEVVQGDIPSMEAITARPGRIQFEVYDQKAGKVRQRDPLPYVSIRQALEEEKDGNVSGFDMDDDSD